MRHHYLPQFYLRQWTSPPDNLLWQYTRATPTKLGQRRVAPASTAYREDLYVAIDPVSSTAEERKHDIETKFFGILDDRASVAFQKMLGLRAGSLSTDDRESWVCFMSSLLERDPETLGVTRSAVGKAGDEVLARLPAEGRAKYQAVLTPDVRSALEGAVLMQTMMAQIMEPAFIQYLLGHEWHVIPVEPNLRLLTSDLPIVLNLASLPRYPIETLAMALSPRHLFVSHRRHPEFNRDLLVASMLKHNETIVSSAGKYLYSEAPLAGVTRTLADAKFGTARSATP